MNESFNAFLFSMLHVRPYDLIYFNIFRGAEDLEMLARGTSSKHVHPISAVLCITLAFITDDLITVTENRETSADVSLY